MAKILNTAIVADIRNKVAGTVFSKNRYGSYIRTKVTPVNPQSTAQQLSRNRLSTFSSQWRELDEEERQGWIDGAVNFPFTDIFGNSKILSGQALFNKLNINLAIAGQAAITECPAPVSIPALNSIVLTAADAPTLSIAFAPTPVPAGFRMIIQATPNVGQGISFVKNRFRFIQSVAAAAATPSNILAAWQAINGNPVSDNKIFVRVFYISTITGQAGIPLQAMAIVSGA